MGGVETVNNVRYEERGGTPASDGIFHQSGDFVPVDAARRGEPI